MVAGAIAGRRQENMLRQRNTSFTRRLHRQRVPFARPVAISSWRHGVISAAEAATLWQLPSPGIGHIRLARRTIPRAPAPPDVARAPLAAPAPLVRAPALAPAGGVGSFDAPAAERPRRPAAARARRGGGMIALVTDEATGADTRWAARSGRRTSATAAPDRQPGNREDVRDGAIVRRRRPGRGRLPDRAGPKRDLADKALSVIPRHRRVWILDLAEPEIGINPLLIPARPDAVADAVVEGFRDTNEDGAIMASSDRYLRQAAIGALIIAREERRMPTMGDLYRLLLPHEDTMRRRVAELCDTHGELARNRPSAAPEIRARALTCRRDGARTGRCPWTRSSATSSQVGTRSTPPSPRPR